MSNGPVDRQAAHVPSVWRCMVILIAVRLSLRCFGFGRTWRALQRSARVASRARPISLDATASQVAVAAACLPGRLRCLEQSLTLWLMLRRYGVAVSLRLGIKPYAPLAHAWVEYDGAPLNEKLELIRKLVPLPEIPA